MAQLNDRMLNNSFMKYVYRGWAMQVLPGKRLKNCRLASETGRYCVPYPAAWTARFLVLLHKAVGSNLTCIFVDHGLL